MGKCVCEKRTANGLPEQNVPETKLVDKIFIDIVLKTVLQPQVKFGRVITYLIQDIICENECLMSANFQQKFKKIFITMCINNQLSGVEDIEFLPEDIILVKVKVKQSLYVLEQTLRLRLQDFMAIGPLK